MFLTTLMHTIDCVSASTDSPTKIGVVNYKIIKFISILIHQPPPLSLYCFFPSLAPPGHEPPLPGHEPPLPPSLQASQACFACFQESCQEERWARVCFRSSFTSASSCLLELITLQ